MLSVDTACCGTRVVGAPRESSSPVVVVARRASIVLCAVWFSELDKVWCSWAPKSCYGLKEARRLATSTGYM